MFTPICSSFSIFSLSSASTHRARATRVPYLCAFFAQRWDFVTQH
jgi:hypothetical protein